MLDVTFFVKVRVQAGVQPLFRCFYNEKWTRTTDHKGHENAINTVLKVKLGLAFTTSQLPNR